MNILYDNLSKCYLESGKLDTALQISEKSLTMNKTLFGDDHVSNGDILCFSQNSY